MSRFGPVSPAVLRKLGVTVPALAITGELKLSLPFPPSVNHYWRHVGSRTLLSARGRSYRKAVEAVVMEACRGGTYGKTLLDMDVKVFRPDNRRRDLDNTLKAVLDSLQHAGVYDDDSQVFHLSASFSRVVGKPGGVLVTLNPLDRE